jgi:Holliday junction resolvase RusA-like endonuclease
MGSGINSLITEIQGRLKNFESDALVFHSKTPVSKHFVKKNSRPIYKRGPGRSFIGKSDDLIKQEKFLRYAFLGAAAKQRIQAPLEHDLHAIYHFHFGPDVSRQYKTTDLSNLFEIVSDSLQCTRTFAGVIKNDNQIKSFDGSRKFKNETTFLEVFLLKFTENTDLTL